MTDLSEEDAETVTVPRWALAYILDHADFDDRGPYQEGWRSTKMQQAVDALEKSR